MAFEKPLVIHSFTAASDMTSASQQYCFVKFTGTTETVLPCTATTDLPCGVLQNLPKQGAQAEVLLLGISKVRVGGTSLGNVSGTSCLIGIDNAGRAGVVTPGVATGMYIVGRLLSSSASADGGGVNDGALVTCSINCIVPTKAT